MKRCILIAILALALTGISILVYGYEYGTNPNQIQVLPFIEKIKDPALFGNDYYVDTVSRFPSAYPYLMAFLSRRIALEPLHLALYIIFKFLLLFFAYNLALFLFSSGRTAGLAMFLFAFSPLVNIYSLLGHDPLMKTAFYQTSAAAPFAILAISLFLKNRYKAASVTLACIYYINVLLGNFLFIIFLFAAACEYIYRINADRLKKMRSAFFLFMLLMAPAAAWVICTNIRFPGHASHDFVLWLKSWYPGHYFPSFWSRTQWHNFIVACLFFMIFFRNGLGRCREKNAIQSFVWGLVTMWSVAFVAGDFLPSRRVILLQFFRSDILFISLALVFAADYIRSLFGRRMMRDIVMAGLVLFTLMEFTRPYYGEFVLVMLLLYEYRAPVSGFLKKMASDPEKSFGLTWSALIIFLIALSVFYFLAVGMPAKVFSISVLLVMLLLNPKVEIAPRFVNACIVAMAVFSLIPYISTMHYRIANADLSNFVGIRAEADWKKLQRWARDNTPENSIFIAPLDMNGFRVFSRRQVFADWVDGAAMHWVPGFEEKWVDRLARIGCGRKFLEANAGIICGFGSFDMKSIYRLIYDGLDENIFRGIKKDFGAEYVIKGPARKLAFKEVYGNSSLRLYRID